MTTKTNKISPLEELRIEKAALRQECAEQEEVLEEYWDYLSENAGSLLFNSAINEAKKRIGLTPSRPKIRKDNEEDNESGSIFNNIIGITKSSFPLIWEFLQPIVIGFVMKKIKDKFSGKKEE